MFLAVRSDDFEKQLHGSINAQRGSHRDCANERKGPLDPEQQAWTAGVIGRALKRGGAAGLISRFSGLPNGYL